MGSGAFISGGACHGGGRGRTLGEVGSRSVFNGESGTRTSGCNLSCLDTEDPVPAREATHARVKWGGENRLAQMKWAAQKIHRRGNQKGDWEMGWGWRGE